MSNQLKEYVVCDELINGEWGHYTVRANTDCNPRRFNVVADFDSYEEADDYIAYLRNPYDDYFEVDM